MTNPTAGADALIKHTSSRISAFSSVRYQAVKVTRVTKARAFVQASPDHGEREFRLDNLREYGEKSWRADELIIDPGLIAKALAEQAAAQARARLEGEAMRALSDLRALFEGNKVHNRSEAEIAAIVALRNSFCISAAENVGPTP